MKYNQSRIEQLDTSTEVRSWISEFKSLVKFRLSLTVVFSAVMAYMILSGGSINWLGVLVLATGGFLVTGAANALNQVLERDYDKLMKRTAGRPLAKGRMTVSTAVLMAGLMSLFGITLLAMFNPLVSFLGMISLMSYSFVYTPLKRVSPVAVFVGAIPGALPILIGAVAAEGTISLFGLLLFGVQFFWQFPHFWSIAWLANEDYQKAGFHLLPSKELDENVGKQSLYFSLMIFPVLILLAIYGFIGIVSTVLLILLTGVYSYFAWNLFKKCDRLAARKLMFSSLMFLPVALSIVLISSFFI